MIGSGAWVKCDQCGLVTVSNRQDIPTFLGVTRRAGWTRCDPGWHYCPTCSARQAVHARRDDQPTLFPVRDPKSPRQIAGLTTARKATP